MPPRLILTLLSIHETEDVLFWLLFTFGGFLYLLKKSGDSVRLKQYARRSDYLAANWITALIRCVFEFPFYYIWRHTSLLFVLKWFGYSVGAENSISILSDLYTSFFAAIAVGFFADTLLLSLTHWQRIPEKWRLELSEQIPELPKLPLVS